MPDPPDITARLTNVFVHLPKIITGKDGRYPQIRNLFWTTVARVFFTKLHASFKARSRGSTDSFGATWNPLKPKTIKIKSRVHKRRGRPLPASKHPTWRNYDTGDLMEATRPGKIVGGSYLPPKDQVFELHLDKLVLGVKTEYAEEVNKLRPLYLNHQADKWVDEAVFEACQAIIPLIVRIKPTGS